MGSFADRQPTTFNPYVKQLPTEEMSMVGMELQRRYDQGVQRIQATIDRIGGLDVANDADKAYLQSKLNGLSDKLMLFSGADFSKFQLTNSVAGMAADVAKDENVMNAVMSTANYRKQQKAMEKAREEGKSAPQNEWDFQLRANEWLSATTPGQKFNASYTPYVDVKKKWFDVFKALHPDVSEQDIPYDRKPDGSIDYDKAAAAMQRISREYVSAEKIENALRASLTPEEMNQLSIDGRYTFRGADQTTMVNANRTKFGGEEKRIIDKITQLKGTLALSSADPNKVAEIEGMIKYYQNLLKKNYDEFDGVEKYILSDLEGSKASLYKESAISQFAQAYAWENRKENVLDNPIVKQQNEERNYALRRSEFNRNVSNDSWRRYMDVEQLKLTRQDLDRKLAETQAKLYGTTGGFTTYMGNSTNVKSPYTALLDDISTLNTSVTAAKRDIIKNSNGEISAEQLESAITRYKGGDREWYKGGSLKKEIPVQLRSAVENIINQEKKLHSLSTLSSNVQTKVDAEIGGEIAKVKESIKGMEGITIDVNGKKVSYTPEEIATFMSIRIVPSVQGVPVTYRRQLNDKEKLLAEGFSFTNSSQSRQFAAISDKVDEAVQKVMAERQSKLNEELMSRTGMYIPMESTIITPDVEAQSTWKSNALLALSRYERDNGGAETLSKDDLELAKTWLSSEGWKNVSYSMFGQSDRKFLAITKDGKTIDIPLTQKEAAQLPFGKTFPSTLETEVTARQSAQGGSTNPTKSFEDAYYSNFDLQKISKLPVSADLVSEYGSGGGVQFIQLHLLLNNNKVLHLDLDKRLGLNEANAFLRTMVTDEQVKQAYLASPDISEADKEIIKNL